MNGHCVAEGKIVVTFKDSGKFNTRYSTLELQSAAPLWRTAWVVTRP